MFSRSRNLSIAGTNHTRPEQASRLLNLPAELIFEIYDYLPLDAQYSLRLSCRKFFLTFLLFPENNVRRLRMTYPAVADFTLAWQRDVYQLRTVEAERNWKWHCFRKSCCGSCLMQHPRRLFSPVELAKDPAERSCKGRVGAVHVSHDIWLKYDDLKKLPFETGNGPLKNRWQPSYEFFSWERDIDLQTVSEVNTFPFIEKRNSSYVLFYRRALFSVSQTKATTPAMLQDSFEKLGKHLYICPHSTVMDRHVRSMWLDIDSRNMNLGLPSLEDATPQEIENARSKVEARSKTDPWAWLGHCKRAECKTTFWFGRARPINKSEDEVYMAVERWLGSDPYDENWLAQLDNEYRGA